VGLLTDSKKFALLAEARMQAAGYNAVAYTGDVSKLRREWIKQEFIAGRIQYLIGTVQAMGTGLDGLQRVCSKVIWLNKPDGDPKLEDQALGRYFRQGRTLEFGDFVQVVLVQNDSADEKILEGLVASAASLQASFGAHNLAA
jgi:superfamily II DNA or RNA helicase